MNWLWILCPGLHAYVTLEEAVEWRPKITYYTNQRRNNHERINIGGND